MVSFHVHPGELHTAAAVLRGDAATVGGQSGTLASVRRDASYGVATSHAALANACEEWGRVESVVLTALADAAWLLAEGLASAAEGYQAAEDSVATRWAGAGDLSFGGTGRAA